MSADLENSSVPLTLAAKTEAFQRDTRRADTCPRCRLGTVRRSRSRWWWESVRKAMTSQRPFRCDRCDWRGWRPSDPALEAGLRTDVPLSGRGEPNRADTPSGEWRQLDLLLLDVSETSHDKNENEENLRPEI